MARTKVPLPVTFQIRPANRGLNYSEPPQTIDRRESPNMINTRFNRGTLQFRSGFKKKYRGLPSSALWIDTVWSGGSSNLIAITADSLYYEVDGIMLPANMFEDDGSADAFPQFTMTPDLDAISIDTGQGRYDFLGANGAAIFPSIGGFDDISVLVNNTSDGIWFIAYTGAEGTPVEAEVCGNADCPTQAKAVLIFNDRVFALGTQNSPNEIAWSAQNNFHTWDVTGGGGTRMLTDSPDRIQTAKRLGEYMIVYKERSIYIGRITYLTDPPVRFSPAPGQGIGLAAPSSVGELGEEHLFLGWDDVYVFSLKGTVPIGTRVKEEMFYGDLGILPEYLHACTGIIAEEFDEYWLFVPTGKWPGTADDPIINRILNPIFESGTDGNTPTNWTERQDGDGTALLDDNGGGTFHDGAMDMVRTTGSVVEASQMYDFNEVIDNWKFSAVIWVSSPENNTAFDFFLRTWDSASDNETVLINGTVISQLVSLADGVIRVVISGEVNDTDAEKIELTIALASANKTLEVHAVHLVRIDNVDDKYHTGVAGSEEVGYMLPDGTVQTVPLIVDRLGNWLPDTVWVYNYEKNAWSAWRLPMTGFGYDSILDIITIGELEGTIAEQTWRFDEKRIEAFAPTNLIGQADGNIYEVASTHVKDWMPLNSTAFLAFWESKDFDLDNPVIDKTFSRLVIYHAADHAAITITVGVSTDSGATAWQEQDVTVVPGTTKTYADFFVTGTQVRFRVKAIAPGFQIAGFAVKIIPRGEAHAI